jgi:hypothetical protein
MTNINKGAHTAKGGDAPNSEPILGYGLLSKEGQTENQIKNSLGSIAHEAISVLLRISVSGGSSLFANNLDTVIDLQNLLTGLESNDLSAVEEFDKASSATHAVGLLSLSCIECLKDIDGNIIWDDDISILKKLIENLVLLNDVLKAKRHELSKAVHTSSREVSKLQDEVLSYQKKLIICMDENYKLKNIMNSN